MKAVQVYLEVGKRKTFACALDWPGWCRSGNTPEKALAALADYAPRYARVLAGTGLAGSLPETPVEPDVVALLDGSATTDFGAPGAIPEADHTPLDQAAFERFRTIMQACWQAFESALVQSEGIALRTGPRGGGRDQEKMVRHVIDGHHSYLRKLGWKPAAGASDDPEAQMAAIRAATTKALTAALSGDLPEAGPRGGKLWPPRYFVRRAAWHILDHAWEIEDRIE